MIEPGASPRWVNVNVNFKDTTNILNQVLSSNLVSPLRLLFHAPKLLR